MRVISLMTILWLFTVMVVQAQRIEWEWVYTEPAPYSEWSNSRMEGKQLVPTADGGWIVTANGGYYSSVILRTDGEGRMRWMKKAGSIDTSTVLELRLTRELPDGNVDFIGTTSFYLPRAHAPAGPMYRAVYRGVDGELDSVHISLPDSTPYNYYGFEAGSVAVLLPDGGLMQVAPVQLGSDTERGGLRFTRANVQGARMDLDTGSWVKYPGGGGDTALIPVDIFRMPDAGYLVVGNITWLSSLHRPFLLRTDSNCRQIWKRILTPPGNYVDAAMDAALLPNGDVLVCGMLRVKDSTTGAIISMPHLIKADSSGNRLWEHSYPVTTDGLVWGISPVARLGGGYVMSGRTVRSGTGSDYLVIGVDSSGAMLWDTAWGGNGEEGLWALSAMPDGGAVVTGFKEDATSGRRLYLARILPPPPASVEGRETGDGRFVVSPLPAFDHLNIRVEGGGNGEIAMVDMLGRVVRRMVLEQITGLRQIDLDLQGLAEGRYLIQTTLGGWHSTLPVSIVR